MDMTRRDFFRLGTGVAAAAIVAGLGLKPRRADAIIGIDDALLGAVVVAVASLGGYALYNQYSGNLGLQAVGASFGNYVSSAPNRTAAAAAAAQIAATYGLTTTQERFQAAAELIANGGGAFADALTAAGESGRLALDGIVSGTDDIVGAFRELVAGYFSSGQLIDMPQNLPGLTTVGPDNVVLTSRVFVWDWQAMRIYCNATDPGISVTWGGLRRETGWGNGASTNGSLICGDGEILRVAQQSGSWLLQVSGNVRGCIVRQNNNGFYTLSWERINTSNLTNVFFFDTDLPAIVSGGIVHGPQLPAVDKPADVPDVIGAGWDSVPLATDMVISPTTGEVVSAGSVPLPTGIPTTAGDYAAALQGALAGVVTDAIALPLSVSVPVTVATPLGVETMPLSQAISTETSLQLDYAPSIPIDPILPPVEVPEGPWSPAVNLPFAEVWPFNMIYDFISTIGRLGGVQ